VLCRSRDTIAAIEQMPGFGEQGDSQVRSIFVLNYFCSELVTLTIFIQILPIHPQWRQIIILHQMSPFVNSKSSLRAAVDYSMASTTPSCLAHTRLPIVHQARIRAQKQTGVLGLV
jgi:hypothetical protein